MKFWRLIYTKPVQESVAAENLVRQGYQTYLPMMRARKWRRGRSTSVIEPIFPRYLFISLSDESDNWAPIRSTKGVVKLVRFGDRAARVPDDLVQSLKEREDQSGCLEHMNLEPQSGDRVRIWNGPMAGYEGIFQCKSGLERVMVLLELLTKCARVELSADDIELVSPG